MTDKELHRLGRRELLQLLLEQGREAEKTKRILEETEVELHQLQETYERLRKRLDHKDEQIRELNALLEAERTKREIELKESGSIAEAALRLNAIFDVAQKAADQYLYNIKRLHGSEAELPEMAELLTTEDKAEEAEQTTAQEQADCIGENKASEEPKELETESEPKIELKTELKTEPEETELEEENPKVILLEHVKAEKIRRAEQEVEFSVQTVSAKTLEVIDTEEGLQAASAAGAERVKEAVGIKISESGMRTIVAELKPKKTVVTELIENQSMLEPSPEQDTLESKTEQRTRKVADRPELKVEQNKKEAKRGTFFRQMGKFMRFKVK